MSSTIVPMMGVYGSENYVVEYDFSKGVRSQFFIGMMFLPFFIVGLIMSIASEFSTALVMPALIFLFASGMIYLRAQVVYSQKCTITSTEIRINSPGRFSSTDKCLPLDTVLAVNIIQGCGERCFNCYIIHIETTANEVEVIHQKHGTRVVPIPEGVLIAPLHAHFICDLIIKRRDARRMGMGFNAVQLPYVAAVPMVGAMASQYQPIPYGYNGQHPIYTQQGYAIGGTMGAAPPQQYPVPYAVPQQNEKTRARASTCTSYSSTSPACTNDH
jgi:hypothetical protein